MDQELKYQRLHKILQNPSTCDKNVLMTSSCCITYLCYF